MSAHRYQLMTPFRVAWSLHWNSFRTTAAAVDSSCHLAVATEVRVAVCIQTLSRAGSNDRNGANLRASAFLLAPYSPRSLRFLNRTEVILHGLKRLWLQFEQGSALVFRVSPTADQSGIGKLADIAHGGADRCLRSRRNA